ncbi:putative leader peptide [Streptomyces omiyaensis]|uniref:Leader peptide n=1 Tax=Streptomyces omiyaensis TaxID=68247 RepID=A0ABW7BR64_9ACTN
MHTCRTATPAAPAAPPALPGLTRRRHIDLARVTGTGCRRRCRR